MCLISLPFFTQAHPGYDIARIVADSNTQLGLASASNPDENGAALPSAEPIVESVNDLGKDFGSNADTQVKLEIVKISAMV